MLAPGKLHADDTPVPVLASGNGKTVPPAFVEHEVQAGRLVQLAPFTLESDRSYYLVWRGAGNPGIAALCQWLAEKFESCPGALPEADHDATAAERKAVAKSAAGVFCAPHEH